MANKFGIVVTNIGNALITECILNNTKLVISAAAAGDANGEYYQPTADQTKLINECWRGEIASVQANPNTPNMLDVKIVIPDDVGGFFVRELGLFSENGDLIAVCNYPATEKVVASTGISGKLTAIMHILITDASVVEFVIKPSLGAISQEELNIAISVHDGNEDAHPELKNLIEAMGETFVAHELDVNAHTDVRKMISTLNARNRSVTLYASLEEIGLTVGKETVATIAQAMNKNSELFYATGASNASIYPGVCGLVKVICKDTSHIRFQWTERVAGIDYVGVYCAANSVPWSGWKKVGSDITLDSLGAVAKAGDTMEGILKAGSDYQTADDYLVRNQKIREYTTEADVETPGVSGAICWHYK